MDQIHPQSNIALDMREQPSLIKGVPLNRRVRLGHGYGHSSNPDTTQKAVMVVLSGPTVIINSDLNGLVRELPWVGDRENELLIPNRVQVLELGLSLLGLVVKVHLYIGAGGPFAVFWHKVRCVLHFHHQLRCRHVGEREREGRWWYQGE
uniref:Uncharacterized protein n=1 Tax=Opuntia streptacantha TaxID=393608 RepID=A0A7C9DNP1_OPUST